LSAPEREFSDDDLRELHALFQSAALRAFPNPERIGCPGSKILEELAALPLPSRHPAYEHVKSCSPCLQELLELRAARVRTRKRALRRRVLWSAGVAAAVVLCALGLFFLRARKPSFEQLAREAVAHGSGNLSSEPSIAVVDYRTPNVERGHEAAVPREVVFARSTREIWILLRPGTSSGRYLVELRDATLRRVSGRYGGTASKPAGTVADFPVILRAAADLSHVPTGRYVLAWDRVGSADWDYEAVRVQ
jgi:hypothetical protein